ncbi:FAD-dependent oxidoreductase [Paenibacillus sp. A3]|nr:FAD-binding oxidoreductase [Paenibacillus sp. A3]
MNKKKIVVIGAGIVGASMAYEHLKSFVNIYKEGRP